MAGGVQTGTIQTKIPARSGSWTASRSRSSATSPGGWSQPNSGIHITAGEVTGLAASLYVAGACVGALFFGYLTDRFGRKKLFMVTLAVYLAATALTALSFNATQFGTVDDLAGTDLSMLRQSIEAAVPLSAG